MVSSLNSHNHMRRRMRGKKKGPESMTPMNLTLQWRQKHKSLFVTGRGSQFSHYWGQTILHYSSIIDQLDSNQTNHNSEINTRQSFGPIPFLGIHLFFIKLGSHNVLPAADCFWKGVLCRQIIMILVLCCGWKDKVQSTIGTIDFPTGEKFGNNQKSKSRRQ